MTAPTTGTPPEDSLSALEEERDFLLRSLDDLDRELAAGDIDEDDYRALKDDYTARAAAVLRAIEAVRSGRPEAASETHDQDQPRPPRSKLKVGAVCLAVAVAAGVAGTLLVRSSDERLPGDPLSGDIAATGDTTEAARDLARARQFIGERQILEAIKVYDAILARHPHQPEALAYRGWLVRLAGVQAGNQEMMARGLEYLDRAVAADPGYPDAHFFRGLALYQDRKDPAAAVHEFRAFLASNPPPAMVPLVEDTLRRAEADAQATPSTAPR